MSADAIKLLPLTEERKAAYLSLEVEECQKSFIETPEKSLADAKRKGWGIEWHIECIFAGDTMVGYAMHGMGARGDVWLDRFMIDRRFQHRGYGKAALSAILPLLRERYPQRRHILLSAEPDNAVAIRLYEEFGFRLTGKVEDGEAVMLLLE